jgi:hypothetical protein
LVESEGCGTQTTPLLLSDFQAVSLLEPNRQLQGEKLGAWIVSDLSDS